MGRDIRKGLNKRVLEKLGDRYSTERLGDALDRFDDIRYLVEMRDSGECELRDDLCKLKAGMSYLLNDNTFLEFPRENLADLAHDIDDKIFELIEAAEAIRKALDPLLMLSIEDGDEDEEDLERLLKRNTSSADFSDFD
ncbi:MAG: hypothetical protein H7318_19625 [Oligoflexus sp.]|nr:hypothetical protein [Oligoflexus sp.]